MPAIKEAGDSALLLELEPVIDVQVNARAIAIAAAVREDVMPGVRDVISTYRSVAVYFDPLITDIRDVQASLERATLSPVASSPGRTLEIPVRWHTRAGALSWDASERAWLIPWRPPPYVCASRLRGFSTVPQSATPK